MVTSLPALPDVRDALTALLLDALAAPSVSPIAVIADAAAALPEPLRGPDGTPSLLTGASDIARADVLAYTALAPLPRVVENFGPDVDGVLVGGDAFSVTEVYADPASGFGAVQLRSVADDRAVFVLGDTDFGSLADVLADLTLGRPQVASESFATMVADARTAALGEGRDVVFTGASLGGALAQVAGYETAEAILASSPGGSDRVTVLGIDALGGRDAAEGANGGGLDPAVLGRMNALNIRTEGDVVSRIGSHLGETFTFGAVNASGQPVLLTAAEAHVNFPSLLATLSSDALFAAGVPGDPGEIAGLTLIANTVGPEIAGALLALNLGGTFDQPGPPRLPGTGALDVTGQFFDLDPDADGDTDLRVALDTTAAPAGDILIG